MEEVVAFVAATAAALAFRCAAFAHVTVHPNALFPLRGLHLDRRPRPERRQAATTKVGVEFPSGFIFLSYQSLPQLEAKVIYRQARPSR